MTIDSFLAADVNAQVDPDAACQANRRGCFSMVQALKVTKAEEETKLIYIYIYICIYHGNPQLSFFGVITRILAVQNYHFSWFWGPRVCIYTSFIRKYMYSTCIYSCIE